MHGWLVCWDGEGGFGSFVKGWLLMDGVVFVRWVSGYWIAT